MGIIRIALVSLSAASALLLADMSAARGEDSTGPLQLELELVRESPGVSVPLDPETVRNDTETAISQIEAQKRVEVLIRDTFGSPGRRPDLTYDVFSGIQSRNLTNVLR